jgi:hypothetical protein
MKAYKEVLPKETANTTPLSRVLPRTPNDPDEKLVADELLQPYLS